MFSTVRTLGQSADGRCRNRNRTAWTERLSSISRRKYLQTIAVRTRTKSGCETLLLSAIACGSVLTSPGLFIREPAKRLTPPRRQPPSQRNGRRPASSGSMTIAVAVVPSLTPARRLSLHRLRPTSPFLTAPFVEARPIRTRIPISFTSIAVSSRFFVSWAESIHILPRLSTKRCVLTDNPGRWSTASSLELPLRHVVSRALSTAVLKTSLVAHLLRWPVQFYFLQSLERHIAVRRPVSYVRCAFPRQVS